MQMHRPIVMIVRTNYKPLNRSLPLHRPYLFPHVPEVPPDYFPVTFDNLTNYYYFLASPSFPFNRRNTNGAI